MLTIGLVVEGTHDFVMLDPLVKAEISRLTGESISYQFLQPMPDQTGAMGGGGWSRVVAWCQRYQGSEIDTFLFPLFSSQSACDAIVIHLDGDSLEELQPHTKVLIPTGEQDVDKRVIALTSVLEDILSLSPTSRKRLAFALPVMQTEAWIIAAEGFGPNSEKIDSKTEFRKHFPTGVGGMKRRYEQRVKKLKSRVPPSTCRSYARFQNSIAKVFS